MQPATSRPHSIDQLFDRACALAGQTFTVLAKGAGLTVPPDLRRDKGWVGQLIERYLGASAGSKQAQDFPELGVELKTIPIDAHGKPLETTFVCTTPLLNVAHLNWETSNVCNKLRCVLWLPIDGRRSVPLAERTVGSAFIWQPTLAQQHALQQDWQHHMERIALGEIEQITARDGEVMQLRPKAANGSVVTEAMGPQGQLIHTRPRGFYLRKEFTQQIIEDAFR